MKGYILNLNYKTVLIGLLFCVIIFCSDKKYIADDNSKNFKTLVQMLVIFKTNNGEYPESINRLFVYFDGTRWVSNLEQLKEWYKKNVQYNNITYNPKPGTDKSVWILKYIVPEGGVWQMLNSGSYQYVNIKSNQ